MKKNGKKSCLIFANKNFQMHVCMHAWHVCMYASIRTKFSTKEVDIDYFKASPVKHIKNKHF